MNKHIFLILFIFTACSKRLNLDEPREMDRVFGEVSHRVWVRTNQILDGKYEILPATGGGELFHDIKSIEFGYFMNANPTPDEAALLLKRCLKVCIDEINLSKKLRPYLRRYPVDIEFVTFDFSFPTGSKIGYIKNRRNHIVARVNRGTGTMDIRYEEITMADLDALGSDFGGTVEE